MGQIEKLEEYIRKKPAPRDIPIEDIKRLLEAKGFSCSYGGKNHLKASHLLLDRILIIPPPHPQKGIKPPYIKQIILALDELQEAREGENR